MRPIYNHVTGELATKDEIASLHSVLDVHADGTFIVADRKGWCQIHDGSTFESCNRDATPFTNLQAAILYFGLDDA